jgi:hypothetical protein
MKDPTDVPDDLNRIVDKVLAYRPRLMTKAAKKRKRKKAALGKKSNPPNDGGFLIGVRKWIMRIMLKNEPVLCVHVGFLVQDSYLTGVPGLFCTSSNERDWTKRSGRWRRERSIRLSRL